MTRERALELKYRLWLSGRFTKHEVMLTPPSRYSQCRLQIEVVEYEKAPRLAEPLTPAEEILLKCRRWFLRPSGWGGDLVYRSHLPERNVVAIVSATRGALLTFYGATPKSGPAPVIQALRSTLSECGIYDIKGGKKYVFWAESGGLWSR